MKYRNESYNNSGIRDAVEVVAFEMFELENLDIPEYLIEHVFTNNDEWKSQLELWIAQVNNGCVYEDTEEANHLWELYEEWNEDDNEEQYAFVRDLLAAVSKKVGTNIQYALWLCDTEEDVRKYYIYDSTDIIDAYKESNIILSDLGDGGKLYGYEKCPEPIEL